MRRNRAYEASHPWLTFQLDLRRVPWDIWLLLGEARSKCEHLAGVPLRPSTAAKMHRVYMAKGVQGTTAIEGNTLTEEQVAQQLAGELKLPPSKAYLQREIKNVISALDWVWEQVRKGEHRPLALSAIKAVNKTILDGLSLPDEVTAGELRTHSVGVASYRGAPAEDCEFLLQRLCEWLEELDRDAPPQMGLAMSFVRAVLAHLYLAWIHPFGDGNGRTARLVEFTILSNAGVPQPAAHLLSNFYNQTRSEYYRQLDLATKSGGDVVPFLRYALQGFVDDLRAQLDHVREQQLDVAWRNYVHELFKDKLTPAKERCRVLILDLSTKSEPVPMRELMQVSPRVARLYAGKTSKTLARDINTLRSMKLIVMERGKGFRAATELIEAFLSATAERPSKMVREET